MKDLIYHIKCFFALRTPNFYCRVQNVFTWWYEYRWQRYLKRHRCCCENSVLRHCAIKAAVNPKKATCYGYIPEVCDECHRRIPKRIIYKYMKLSLFVEYYEDAKEDYIKELKIRERVQKQNKLKGGSK